MLALGLDIGTSKICVTIIDCKSGLCIENFHDDNDTFIKINGKSSKMQDAVAIKQKALTLLNTAIDKYPDIKCIGVTGQMHGIIYLDSDNNIVSPLYTWQDESADSNFHDLNISYAKKLSDITGYKMASGYGLATHFYHSDNKMIPKTEVKISTIHGYIACSLAENENIIIHSSDAHSLGIFNIKNSRFDKDAIEKAQINYSILPKTINKPYILGKYLDKIPVCVAIGDNQAGFIGSGCTNDILVNIGTGSQISLSTNKSETKSSSVEIRPLNYDQHIFVGASLCGGRAFAILKDFYTDVIKMANLPVPKNLYDLMLNNLENTDLTDSIVFNTLFCGTRDDSSLNAGISNISTDNFNAGNMTNGTLEGIAVELYNMYKIIKKDDDTPKNRLIGSGNAIRKTPPLRRILEKKFNMPLYMPKNSEEAAFGAALYACVAIGIYNNLEDAQQIIQFEEIV